MTVPRDPCKPAGAPGPSGPRSRGGFTLIEVTLSIVVGIIMISGSVLLYAQAKTSAGNGRAKVKVQSVQATAEEMSARKGGVYPLPHELYPVWAPTREDVTSNPWGGTCPMTTAGSDFNTVGFGGDGAETGNLSYGVDPTFAGCIRYNVMAPLATNTVWDISIGQNVTSYGYNVAIGGPSGEKRYFVLTGK